MLIKTYCKEFLIRKPYNNHNLICMNGFNTDDNDSIKENEFFQSKFQAHNVAYLDWLYTEVPGFILDYFLARFQAGSQASRIANWLYLYETMLTGCDIICHSMGNKAFLDACNATKGYCKIQFNNLFMIAPDVRCDYFDINPKVRTMFKNVYVFHNKSDRAMMASTIANAHARMGDHGCNGVNNIDCHSFASKFDHSAEHGYYRDLNGEQSPVITQIQQILNL